MYKPTSLRDHLTAALPDLRRDPHRLIVLITDGNIQCTASGSLSWRYDYTLRVLITDWTGHADAVMAPLLLWLQTHQNELLANRDRKGIRFEAEYITQHSMDLLIELELTENVLVRSLPAPQGAMELQHRREALGPLDMPIPEHWSFWLQGEKLAEWDYDPRQPPPAAQG